MRHMSADTFSQILMGTGLLMALLVVGVLIVQRFRGLAAQRGPTAGELLTNFEEMRSRGDIDDADYRKIKSVLGAELHGGLKDGKDKG